MDGESAAPLKERVRAITSRNRGHKVQTVIDELVLYVRGWLNYYKLSSTYKEVLALAVWVRRRVRLYYWKPWNARPEGALWHCPRRQPAAHASPLPVGIGNGSRHGAHGDAKPERLPFFAEATKDRLADEPERDCAKRAEQPLA